MLHVACCMVVNRVLSHSSHFPSRTHLFPIIILSIRTVSADILESGRTLNSQHTCTNVTSPSPGILQLFRFHLSECLVACWEIEPWGYFMVRAFVVKAIHQSRGPRPNNMNAGLRIRSRWRSTSAEATEEKREIVESLLRSAKSTKSPNRRRLFTHPATTAPILLPH